MLLVPRRVRKIFDSREFQQATLSPEEISPVPLTDFRDLPAWILLGEPGSGKSTSLEQEAKATGGEYLSIAVFKNSDWCIDWQDKTLFLDGLDEIRGDTDEGISILTQIAAKLNGHRKPRFRLACRAADWHGNIDRNDILNASPDGQIAVLLLEPLNNRDIVDILRQNHRVTDPDGFMENAEKSGIGDLLNNPETLRLIAEVVKDNQWPKTRQEVYQLACEKLAAEANKRHRISKRKRPISTDELLEAAGRLFAVQLLSDKTGVAMDSDSADEQFPHFQDFMPTGLATVKESLNTRLFRPEGEERLIPSHRSIAEFLAARWLAEQVERHGMPLRRILNLILGRNKRTVANLRGLYGWLALHCRQARKRLIEADPVTVVIYGDVKPFPPADKRLLLHGLKRETEDDKNYIYTVCFQYSAHALGALADRELTSDFMKSLETSLRDDSTQSFVFCLLNIIEEGDPIPPLTEPIKKIVLEETWNNGVRRAALLAWLHLEPNQTEGLALLEDIAKGKVSDPTDELAGLLLCRFYSEQMAPKTLLNHLHIPRMKCFGGPYNKFWEEELPKQLSEQHLPIVLDMLAQRNDIVFKPGRIHLRHMVGMLMLRGLESFGERIPKEQLFRWLGIGMDQFSNTYLEENDREKIAQWITRHPECYKSVFMFCFDTCSEEENPDFYIRQANRRLHGAKRPEDMGLWHLNQVPLAEKETTARLHLKMALQIMSSQHSEYGSIPDPIKAWSEAYPEKKHWLDPLLPSYQPSWRVAEAAEEQAYQKQKIEERRNRTIQVNDHLSAIRSGTANVGLMHHLAEVWKYPLVHELGETRAELFNKHYENGAEVLTAAELGFLRLLERTDLPTVDQILNLHIHKQMHWIRLPCLIGMELVWQKDPESIPSLSEALVQRMIAFRLTYGAEVTPPWFTCLVRTRPDLVASVLIDYASLTLRSDLSDVNVNGIYSLLKDPDYREVALLAVPELLASFPLRVKADKLSYLEWLLKAALRYRMPQYADLLIKKTDSKNMGITQKVYWLAAGMLLDPLRYETKLWSYVGHNKIRIHSLATFLHDRLAELKEHPRISAGTLSRAIEVLAPHADPHFLEKSGWVTDSRQRGETVESLIFRLRDLATDEAAEELNRLCTVPALHKFNSFLEQAHSQLREWQREKEFHFHTIEKIVQVLCNRAPVGMEDFTALVLDHLDGILYEIRNDDDDGYKRFWNEATRKVKRNPYSENRCRDELLDRLKNRLHRLQHLDCRPEVDCSGDKRADIIVSYPNNFRLPIEVKLENNPSLWTALKNQLIRQYSNHPQTKGYGIYLVLWFGRKGMPVPTDGGKKPQSALELQIRLEKQLDPDERRRIFVRVLDVSWPSH